MRDGNTQIYHFAIREPPPREPSVSVPQPDDPVTPVGPAYHDPEPTPSRTTPVGLPLGRRPLPQVRRASLAGVVHEWRLIAAGLLLGLGIGGSIDSSAFHQVVQFHAGGAPGALVGVKTDPLWDGLLHACTWLGTLVGLGLLWGLARRAGGSLRTAPFVGSLMLGWGAYNVFEGAIDYRMLRLSHVPPSSAQLLWDGGLIVSGVALILAGALCIAVRRRSRR